ncbi:RHS repeat-associated core domain-containing protein [Myxococcus sp. RHSTA-1-4]|uniref:RHS repeat-associated core domain-containing protein n=1 Tax=Myxococcus sp. RHSTA-1-4 TaxID=2874601 RepID=UPI001CC0A789|nr:RHS repeat-associated core domain-containing protein [Myxococcus sp. RHSTA-1-4]MBZ4416289.1 FG-GAP-like repeat-containing protein [Myxococcus sp. RHSTA-1-4]
MGRSLGALDATSPMLSVPSETLLPSAPAESLAAGTTPVQTDVTADGAASVVLPLWVPPGRGGLQPSLSLAYNSRGGDGWLGVGFQLTGLSQIAGCPQTTAQDGINAHPATPLCLDGMRLVPVATGEYRLEVDSHTQVRSTPSGFEVRTPDGRILTYGQDGTREDAIWRARKYPTYEQTVLAWRLSSVRDSWNNRMDVFYESSPLEDGYSSWHRPARITYTRLVRDDMWGSGMAAQRSVNFIYEVRPDTFLGYQKGARIGRAHRLSQIVMSGPAYGTGLSKTTAVLRRYLLSYINTSVSGRSLLSSVQECDIHAVCKPPVRFDWELGSWEFIDKPVTELFDARSGVGVHAFGLGAGRTGLSFFTHTSAAEDACDPNQPVPCEFWRQYWHRLLTFRPGGIFESTYHVSSGTSIWDEDHPNCQAMEWRDYHPQVVDWDGYGKSSLAALSCIAYATPEQLTGWTHLFIGAIRGLPNRSINIGTVSKMALWLDMDGDHLNDFAYNLATPGGGRELHLITPRTHLTVSPGLTETKFGARVVDLYGDGKMAVVGEARLPPPAPGTPIVEQPPLYAYRYELWSAYDGYRGHALVPVKTSIQRPFWHTQSSLSLITHPHEFFFADVNGDGLSDAVTFGYDYEQNATRLDFQVNSGLKEDATQEGRAVGESSFLPAQVQRFTWLNPYTRIGSEVRSGDFNGDGRQDVLLVTPDMPMRVLLADAEGTFSRVEELDVPAGSDPAWVQVADVDNDGMLDVTHRKGNLLHVAFRKNRLDVLRSVRPGTQLPDAQGRTGPEVRFTYAPLADPSVYTTRFVESFDAALQHLRRASETMLVVKRLDDGLSQRAWTYSYKDGRVDVHGRGWLGFAERTVTDALTNATTVTRFNNEHHDEEGRDNGNYLVFSEAGKQGQSWAARAHRPTSQVETVQAGNGTVRKREVTWTYRETPRTPATSSERPGSYQQYVSSTREVVTESRPDGQTVTLSDRETGQTRNADGVVTATFSRLFTGTKVEEVRKTVEPLEGDGPLFDITLWLPRGTWVTRTGWVECARTTMGACDGVQPSALLSQVSHTTYGSGGEVTATELMPGRAGEGSDEKTSALYLKTTYEYDVRGLVTRVVRTDGLGAVRAESYVYDDFDATTLRHTYDSLGNGARYAFVPGLGVLAAVEDANGAWKHMQYDGFGRPRGETTAAGGGQSVEYAWAERLPVVHSQEQGGGDSHIRYDAHGRVVQLERSGFGGARIFVDTTYDELGRVKTQSLPRKAEEMPRHVTFLYDGLDRLVRQTQPDGSATTYDYVATPEGVRTSVTDADGRRREQLTDRRGLLAESSEVGDGGQRLTTRYEYGPFGRLTSTVAPDGARTQQRHDVLGRTEWTSDESAGERFLAYNAFGEVKWQAEGAWRPLAQPLPETLPPATYTSKTVFMRDVLGRVTQQVVRAPHHTGDAFRERVTFDWDTADLGTTGSKARGLLAAARREVGSEAAQPAHPVVETRYTYDGLGRMATTTLMVGEESFTTEQQYDTLGRPSRLLYPEVPGLPRFTVAYEYAPEGGVQALRNAHTGETYWTALAYNGAGQLTRERFGAAVERTHRYDSLGRLRFLDARRGTTPVQRLAYEYSPGGNLTARHDVLGPTPASESFTYDALDRLKRWEVTQGTCGTSTAVDYTYDDAGNLKTRTSAGQVWASYLPTPVGTFPRNAVASAFLDGTLFHYEYDARGNQVGTRNSNGSPLRSVDYTSFDLPTAIHEVATGRTWTYDYDAFGTRVRTSVNDGTEEVVFVDRVYQRRRQGSEVTHLLSVQGPTGTVAEVTWKSDTPLSSLFLLSDRQGSPDTVVSQEGAVVERIKYEPFGERRSASNLLQRPAGRATVRTGFTGHEEVEGGLTHMGGRLYDARLARFLSPDPVVVDTSRSQAFHPYAYVLNNPLKYTDPSGLTPEGDGLPVGNVSSTYDYGGGWTAHVFPTGSSPSTSRRDPVLDASAIPQAPAWAVDDGTHLPNQYKDDSGSSASSSPGPQPNLGQDGATVPFRDSWGGGDSPAMDRRIREFTTINRACMAGSQEACESRDLTLELWVTGPAGEFALAQGLKLGARALAGTRPWRWGAQAGTRALEFAGEQFGRLRKRLSTAKNISASTTGNPAAIVRGMGELSPIQHSVLTQLNDAGTQTLISKRLFGSNDLAALTAATGDEFAMFTTGGRRLLVRGTADSVPISPAIAAQLRAKGWRWSAHTHPGISTNVLRSSVGDRAVLEAMDGSQSAILNSLGERRLFSAAGDNLAGWLP